MKMVNRYALYNTYLNIAYKRKKLFFDCAILPKDKNYFIILKHYGCIRYFFFSKGVRPLNMRVYLSYNQFCPSCTFIKNYSLTKRHIVLSYNVIRALVCGGVLLIVSTNHGLLSGDACVAYRCGGILISVIFS